MSLCSADDNEAAISRFSLVKGKSYIIIFNDVDELDGGSLKINVQRGIVIKSETYTAVKKNFEVAALRGFHEVSGREPISTPPATFVALAESQAQVAKKRTRAQEFGTPGDDLDITSPYLVSSHQKRAKTAASPTKPPV